VVCFDLLFSVVFHIQAMLNKKSKIKSNRRTLQHNKMTLKRLFSLKNCIMLKSYKLLLAYKQVKKFERGLMDKKWTFVTIDILGNAVETNSSKRKFIASEQYRMDSNFWFFENLGRVETFGNFNNQPQFYGCEPVDEVIRRRRTGFSLLRQMLRA